MKYTDNRPYQGPDSQIHSGADTKEGAIVGTFLREIYGIIYFA